MSSLAGNRNAPPMSRAGLTTGAAAGGLSEARPMTSVSGAGFQSKSKKEGQPGGFDPLNMNKGAAAPLAEKSDNSAEDKAKEMEKNVHRLIEASAEAISVKDMRRGLEKAKEAGKAERSLCKFRDSKGLSDQISLELTFAVTFNIANAYYYNKMYDEAVETYKAIVKNRDYPQAGRLRVNIGNIMFDQKKYPQAIKEYRMALDQIPATSKDLRFKIFRNIGNSFVKLGQFQDAIESFETVMGGAPDIQTAFNLLLCLYARGDKDKIRRHFTKMLTLPVPGMTEDDIEKLAEIPDATLDRVDTLREELQQRHETSNDRVLSSARLIAPIIEESTYYSVMLLFFLLVLFVMSLSVCLSLLSIFCCPLTFSDTTWHASNHSPLNQSSSTQYSHYLLLQYRY
jgi:intraflagellar transport protein 88